MVEARLAEARLRIGYMKLCRSMALTPSGWGIVGGDQEPIIILRKLTRKYPQHEFYLLGKNSGESPIDIGIGSNVTSPWINIKRSGRMPSSDMAVSPRMCKAYTEELYALIQPYFRQMDALIVWMGQHGTSNNPIPKVGVSWEVGEDLLTKSQQSFLTYGSHVIRGINDWQDMVNGKRQAIVICTDCRNMIKCRDWKWPVTSPVLALHNEILLSKHERWRDTRGPDELGYPNARWVVDDPGVWYHPTPYIYSGVEVATMLPGVTPNFTFEGRQHFGLILNESAKMNNGMSRVDILNRWVLPMRPVFIHGKWSDGAINAIGFGIYPVNHKEAFEKLKSIRCTIAIPPSGTGWATRKAWEAFMAGTVCFFHPGYDDQGWVIPTKDMLTKYSFSEEIIALVRWLRCDSQQEFWQKIKLVNESKELWEYLVSMQYYAVQAAIKADRFMNLMDDRIKQVEVLKYGSTS